MSTLGDALRGLFLGFLLMVSVVGAHDFMYPARPMIPNAAPMSAFLPILFFVFLIAEIRTRRRRFHIKMREQPPINANERE